MKEGGVDGGGRWVRCVVLFCVAGLSCYCICDYVCVFEMIICVVLVLLYETKRVDWDECRHL